MSPNLIQLIFVPLLAGLLGTVAMALLLQIPAWLGMPRIDLMRAMGSYITGDRERAFMPGLIIHFAVGIVFGYIYYWAFRFTQIPLTPLHGLFAGAVHGTLVMLVVSIAILEHHPNQRYQRRGPLTGFAQLIGHVLYGLVVGVVCWQLAPYTFVSHIPQ